MQPDRAAVLAALETVRDPKSGRGLVAAGLVQALVVRPGRAGGASLAPTNVVFALRHVSAAC